MYGVGYIRCLGPYFLYINVLRNNIKTFLIPAPPPIPLDKKTTEPKKFFP